MYTKQNIWDNSYEWELSSNLINFKNFTEEWWVSWGRRWSILPPTLLLGMIHTPKMDVLCTFFPVQDRYSSPSPPTQNHSGRGGSNLVSICYGQFDILASYDYIIWGLQMELGGAIGAINSLSGLHKCPYNNSRISNGLSLRTYLGWQGCWPIHQNWKQFYFLPF